MDGGCFYPVVKAAFIASSCIVSARFWDSLHPPEKKKERIFFQYYTLFAKFVTKTIHNQ